MFRNRTIEFKAFLIMLATLTLMLQAGQIHGDHHFRTGGGLGYTSYPFTQTLAGHSDSYSVNMVSGHITHDTKRGWSYEASGFYMVEENRVDGWGGEFMLGKTFTILPQLITGYTKIGPSVIRVNHDTVNRNYSFEIRAGITYKLGVQIAAPFLDKNSRLFVEYDFRDYPTILNEGPDTGFEFGNEFPNFLETFDVMDRNVLKQFRFGIKFLVPERN
jgi:hypothetical protein